MRVLIVEDHRQLAEKVATGLRRAGLAVDLAFDGEKALEMAALYEYAVIVLDRDLPRLHGDEVCQTLAEADGRARILMLTAAATLQDRVDGLGLGADDYLAKPFALAELIARIRALARRVQPAVPPVLAHGDLILDTGRRIAHRRGRPLELTVKELAVLELLMAAAGRVISPEELLEHAWDHATDPFTNTVRVTVSRLRRKLGEPQIIHTVPHAGYRI